MKLGESLPALRDQISISNPSIAISTILFSVAGDRSVSRRDGLVPKSSHARGTRQVGPLTRLHRAPVVERETLTRGSVFVPRVPTGFPARRYSWLSIIVRPPARVRYSLTRSDQPGVTTTHSA